MKVKLGKTENLLNGNNGSRIQLLSPIMIMFITIFIDATGFGMIIPLLPFYAETFQAGSTALGILVASFSIMQFIFSPFLGKISDKIGRKPVLLMSILVSMASFTLFTIANSFLLLLLSRMVAGFATETAVAQAYIADITKRGERVAGIGKVGAAHGAGFIIGPAIGGFLSVYSYSAAGIAAIALTFVNLLFVVLLLPESLNKVNNNQSELDGQPSFLQKIVEAFSTPLIGIIFVIFFIVFLSFSAIPVIVPLLGAAYFSIGAVEMSYLFVYIGIVQIVLQGGLIGRLSAKIADIRLIILGSLSMMIGLILMPLIPSIGVFMFSLTLISSGIGITRTIVPSYISKMTPENEQGGLLGVTNSVASIATVPGPLVGGSLFEFAGLASPFYVSASLLLVSLVLGLRAQVVDTKL